MNIFKQKIKSESKGKAGRNQRDDLLIKIFRLCESG